MANSHTHIKHFEKMHF